jgi:hypothetical protein
MRTVLRIGLIVLAANELALGFWTAFSPESFYNDVPTVDLTPPYSEHLFRDFGGATLGIAVVLIAAVIWLERRLVFVSLIAYLAFSAPHLAFHAGHLHGTSQLMGTVLIITLALSVLLPLALIGVASKALPGGIRRTLDRQRGRLGR